MTVTVLLKLAVVVPRHAVAVTINGKWQANRSVMQYSTMQYMQYSLVWHFTNKSQQTSTHSKFIGTCHYKYFKISTHHTNTQKTTLASYQTKESTTKPVFSQTKHLQINNLHIFTIVFHSRHILLLHDLLIRLFFPFHMSDHHLAKGLSLSSVHASGIHSPLNPWYPKLILSTNIPFQTQNTPLQNCVPSALSHLPGLSIYYSDFDSCYSHFMPYRMTPSVRHRAIEVHYYYYIVYMHMQYSTVQYMQYSTVASPRGGGMGSGSPLVFSSLLRLAADPLKSCFFQISGVSHACILQIWLPTSKVKNSNPHFFGCDATDSVAATVDNQWLSEFLEFCRRAITLHHRDFWRHFTYTWSDQSWCINSCILMI